MGWLFFPHDTSCLCASGRILVLPNRGFSNADQPVTELQTSKPCSNFDFKQKLLACSLVGCQAVMAEKTHERTRPNRSLVCKTSHQRNGGFFSKMRDQVEDEKAKRQKERARLVVTDNVYTRHKLARESKKMTDGKFLMKGTVSLNLVDALRLLIVLIYDLLRRN